MIQGILSKIPLESCEITKIPLRHEKLPARKKKYPAAQAASKP